MNKRIKYGLIALLTLSYGNIHADNPLVTHIYTADPTARVFNDTLYIYPSHDIKEHSGLHGSNGYMMEDYHVFSTTDLMNFTDHGVILSQTDVPYVDNNSYAMWAPDCIERDGKYYFYFPGNFHIGVAISDSPTGPFIPDPNPIDKIGTKETIDPNCFIDDDGQAYLYYGAMDNMRVLKLNDDMRTPAGEVHKIEGLPSDYKEGPFMFKRNGVYYYTFPLDETKIGEAICYATGTSPMGPFEYQGIIMDHWTDNCWTNHHSIVEYRGQWYMFYHHHDLTGDQTLRSMRAEKLYFNEDGTIQKVIPSRRGIGIRAANEQIQIDRFNESSEGIRTPVFHDKEHPGFYVSNITNNSWVTYNDVDFGNKEFISVSARVASAIAGGVIEIRLNNQEGKIIGTIPVANTGSLDKWQTVNGTVTNIPEGLQNLAFVFKGKEASNDIFKVNWVRFNEAGTFHLAFEGAGNASVKLTDDYAVKAKGTEEVLAIANAGRYTFTPEMEEGTVFKGWKFNNAEVESLPSKISDNDVVTAIFETVIVPVNGKEKLEAEYFSYKMGTQTEACPEGGLNAGYVKNGYYLMFKNVDFGKESMKNVEVRASSLFEGGKIEVRIDSVQAEPVAVIDINSTSDWAKYETFTAPVSELKGMHDIYFYFIGDAEYLFNINWFWFK